MVVTINSTKYRIKFNRKTVVKSHKLNISSGMFIIVFKRWIHTTVTLFSETNKLEGISICSPNDVFIKETGRVLALTNAIINLDKENRKLVWSAYHNRLLTN